MSEEEGDQASLLEAPVEPQPVEDQSSNEQQPDEQPLVEQPSTAPPATLPTIRVTCTFQPEPSNVLIAAAIGALIGSSFQVGYNGAVLHVTESLVRDWINSSKEAANHVVEKNRKSEVDLLFNISWSMWLIGGLIGGLSGGFLADLVGRRKAMLISNFLVLVAGILMAISKPTGSVVPMIFGRFINGLRCGWSTVLVPMYLIEVIMRVKGVMNYQMYIVYIL